MNDPASVCVYCGSSDRVDEGYKAVAAAVGLALATAGFRIVYGGGRTGLMGALADAALAAGGTVTGIIPRFLVGWEVAHAGLCELIVVETMHERKKLMADRANAFLALPGGLGTLEEMFETLTWKQLGLHSHPIVLLNPDGYWDHLLKMLRKTVETGFASEAHAALLTVANTPDAALAQLRGAPAQASGTTALI